MLLLTNFLEIISNTVFLTGYINGNNTFPLPLEEEEEEMYLKRLKEGDKDAKGILIERNLRLVAHIVKKYSFSCKDVDELISIGTVGLIKAIDSFDNYPFYEFNKDGLNVTLNTDNRTVSNIDLTHEINLIKDKFSMSKDEYKDIYLKSVDATFADNETKRWLRGLI